jgi:tyrosinase
MATVPVFPRVLAPRIRWRRNITQLTPRQLADFREAMSRAQAISDDRGYTRHAGIHGLPLPISCQHGNADLFLPWHRAYLYFFERALRDFVGGIGHPFWDWTVTRSVPDAYSAEQDPDGRDNPLHHGTVDPVAIQQGQNANPPLNLPAQTVRQPGQPGTALPSADSIRDTLTVDDFFTFSNELESWHGDVHIWVGGHMRLVPVAAFDPIFWAHHTQIDRLWRLWQLRHTAPSFTSAFLNTALPPFPMTVAQTLNVRALGYDYATTAVRVLTQPPNPGPGSGGGS